MDILLYALRLQLLNQFVNKAWWRILLQFLLFLAAGLYAFFFAFLYDRLPQEEPDINQQHLLLGLCGILAAYTLLRTYIPGYTPKRDLIPRLYPTSFRLRFYTGLSVELAGTYFIVLTLAVAVIFAFSEGFGLPEALQAILSLLAAHLIRRIIQTHTDRTLNKGSQHYRYFLAALFPGLAIMAASFWLTVELPAFGFPAMLLASLLLLFADYSAEKTIVEQKTAAELGSRLTGTGSIFPSLLLRNKNSRLFLGMAFLFKAFFLALDIFAYLSEGEHYSLSKMPLLLLVVSPVILFSYIFNNTWGFFRSLWLTVDRCGAGALDIARIQLRLLALPLLIDGAITAVYLCFPNEKFWFLLAYYFGILGIGLPIAIIASLYHPKLIVKFQYGRQTTSLLFSLVLMAGAGLLLLPFYSSWLFLGYPVFIGVALFAAVAMLKDYRLFRHRLYEKLYKVKD